MNKGERGLPRPHRGDAGSVLGLTASMCSRHIMVIGLVQSLVVRTCQHDWSRNKRVCLPTISRHNNALNTFTRSSYFAKGNAT